MSDVKISALPAASALDATEVLPIVQAAQTKQTSIESIVSLTVPGLPWPPSAQVPGVVYAGNSIGVTQMSNAQIQIGTLLAAPMWIPPGSGPFQAIGFRVGAAGSAGSVARIGIYSNVPGQRYPGTLIIDGGEFSATSTGYKMTTLSPAQSFPKGVLLWAVSNVGVASAQLQGPNLNTALLVLGLLLSNNQPVNGYAATAAYGSLPGTFPAGASLISGGSALPSVMFEPA